MPEKSLSYPNITHIKYVCHLATVNSEKVNKKYLYSYPSVSTFLLGDDSTAIKNVFILRLLTIYYLL